MSDELSYACTGCRQPIDPDSRAVVPVWTVIDVPGTGRRNTWIPVEGGMAHRSCLPDLPGYFEGPVDFDDAQVAVAAAKGHGASLRHFLRRPRPVSDGHPSR